MQVEHGDAQADRRVLDGEKRFFLLGHAEAEARVLREAVAFAGDAEEILIELFVPVLVVIECDLIAAGGRGLQAQRRLAFTGIHADAVEAGAFLQESLGVVGIEDRGYQALGAAHLLDRDLDIGWRAGIATVFRGLGLADAEGAVEDEENGEGGRRRDEAGDKTSRVVPGEKVEHRVSLSARSEEHTSELQSLMRISYAVFCL